MYKDILESKLKKIFGFDRVTFDLPSEQFEQDRLYVEVSETHGNVSKTKAVYRVAGSCFVFGQIGKFPPGTFAKKIGNANCEHLEGFFFSPETTPANSQARLLDLIESRIAFTFLYKADIFNPNQGKLTSVEGL